LDLAKEVSQRGGIPIDRLALRRKDCLICWFCENPNWVNYSTPCEGPELACTSSDSPSEAPPVSFEPAIAAVPVVEPPPDIRPVCRIRLSYFDRPRLIDAGCARRGPW
jgi:hypothetical protein